MWKKIWNFITTNRKYLIGGLFGAAAAGCVAMVTKDRDADREGVSAGRADAGSRAEARLPEELFDSLAGEVGRERQQVQRIVDTVAGLKRDLDENTAGIGELADANRQLAESVAAIKDSL